MRDRRSRRGGRSRRDGRGRRGRHGWRRSACGIRHRRQHRCLLGLLERDIDDVILLLAEGVHVDIADHGDFHHGSFAFDLLIDRRDVRRRRQLGVRQIEHQHGAEHQPEFLFVQHRRDTDAVRHFENKTHEGRLDRRADPDRRTLLRLRQCPLLAQFALGDPRALRQFANHLGREGREAHRSMSPARNRRTPVRRRSWC